MAIVSKNVWFPSEILPIVKINALSLVMLLIKWATLSLEIKHEKVRVFLHLMNKPCLQLLGAMSKGAVITIFALAEVLGILGAVLGLVFLWMVHAFYSVVRQLTIFLRRATLSFIVVAQVRRI